MVAVEHNRGNLVGECGVSPEMRRLERGSTTWETRAMGRREQGRCGSKVEKEKKICYSVRD